MHVQKSAFQYALALKYMAGFNLANSVAVVLIVSFAMQSEFIYTFV